MKHLVQRLTLLLLFIFEWQEVRQESDETGMKGDDMLLIISLSIRVPYNFLDVAVPCSICSSSHTFSTWREADYPVRWTLTCKNLLWNRGCYVQVYVSHFWNETAAYLLQLSSLSINYLYLWTTSHFRLPFGYNQKWSVSCWKQYILTISYFIQSEQRTTRGVPVYWWTGWEENPPVCRFVRWFLLRVHLGGRELLIQRWDVN